MLQELIKISKYAGMREDLVQAGGGNTSVKISKNEMLIKASGCQLSEVSKDYGYSRVCYSQIAEYLSTHQDIIIVFLNLLRRVIFQFPYHFIIFLPPINLFFVMCF